MKHVAYCLKFMWILGILLTATSCKKDRTRSSYPLSGRVANTTGQPVASLVLLILNGQSSPSYTTTAGSDGSYEFAQVEAGEYELVVSYQGYNDTSEPLSVNDLSQKDVTILGSANVSGQIIDSQTGLGLADATVSLYASISQDSPSLLVNTDSYGQYTIVNGPTGTFSGTVEAEGFFPRTIETVTFDEGYNYPEPATMVEQPDEGTVRIVLNWGALPEDLDAHFTGPASDGGRFHVYWGEQSYGDDVNLDVDDVSGYGPETITITTFYPGTYRYSVFNFDDFSEEGGAGIASSPARVEVYDFTGLKQVFDPPGFFAGSGNTWRVFEIVVTGTSANINSINTYVQATGSSDTEVFKKSAKKGGVSGAFRPEGF